MISPDKYSTHLEALVMSACSSRGAILELGCGNYSTPVLSAIAKTFNKKFIVKASDKNWYERFRDYAEIIPTVWDEPKFEGIWGTIFLDNEQFTFDRLEHVPTLIQMTEQLVIHDADKLSKCKNWHKYTAPFKQQWYKTFEPWTVVLFNDEICIKP